MRLLANENFPGEAVAALRQRGHDVLWARTGMPGASDVQVLERASSEGRLLLTFDKDFGELAFHAGLDSPCGILLFRVEPRDPGFIASFTLSVVESREDWAGHFGVVEMGRIRLVPLPTGQR